MAGHKTSRSRRQRKYDEGKERQAVSDKRSVRMRIALVNTRNNALRAQGRPCEAKRELAKLEALLAQE